MAHNLEPKTVQSAPATDPVIETGSLTPEARLVRHVRAAVQELQAAESLAANGAVKGLRGGALRHFRSQVIMTAATLRVLKLYEKEIPPGNSDPSK